MSNPLINIRAAFATKLQAFSPLPSVAWENVSFKPTTGQPYIEPSLLPAEPIQIETGTNGINRLSGVYQISVFAPTGTGIAAINTLIAGLCNHFKRGTVLTYGGDVITIQKAYSSPVMQETDWQHTPITIKYWCDAEN